MFNSAFAQSSFDSHNQLKVSINSEGHQMTLNIPLDKILFKIIPHYDSNGISTYNAIELEPSYRQLYSQIGFPDQNSKAAFVYPIFTQGAYSHPGFYDYYKTKCPECLTIPIPDQIQGGYSSSFKTATILKLLNYTQITDVDIDKNPNILKNFDRIVVLHNEYVTKKEFDAITNFQNVTFLFPNALYAEVKTDYSNNTITLIRGHGYPDEQVRNGFDWAYDNSKFEYNAECTDWNFYHRGKNNFSFLNCYPEYTLLTDKQMWITLHQEDPTDLFTDIDSWLRYHDDATTKAVLNDFDLQGSHVPIWIQDVGVLVLNQDISVTEFENMLDYLVEKNVIT
jgi:hypothetical protein